MMHFEPLLDSTQAASILRIHPKDASENGQQGEI
jgi:hypothetical protein